MDLIRIKMFFRVKTMTNNYFATALLTPYRFGYHVLLYSPSYRTFPNLGYNLFGVFVLQRDCKYLIVIVQLFTMRLCNPIEHTMPCRWAPVFKKWPPYCKKGQLTNGFGCEIISISNRFPFLTSQIPRNLTII